MSGQTEFSREIAIETIGSEPRAVQIEAGQDERMALAKRFDLESIEALGARVVLSRNDDVIEAKGTLNAEVTQSCVATARPLTSTVQEEFRIEFRAEPDSRSSEEEIELESAELDVVFYSGRSIDIGEAVAETLSLSLDPYPRSPDADAVLKAAGILSAEEAGPFAALARLRGISTD